jgi:hypothetical protein
MPPPVPYDPAQMIKDARDSGNVFDLAALPFRMYAQKQKHDAAHEEAARIVSERDLAFTQAAGTVPAFLPPPSLNDQGSADMVEHNVTSAGQPPAAVPPARAGGPHPGPAPAPSQGGTAPAAGGGAPGGGTSPAGFTPAGGGPPPGFVPGGGFGPSGFGPGGPAAPPLPAAGGMPMAGHGPAKDGAEPKRPRYLVEPELRGMFGSDELTSPPVIGEG